MNFVGLLQAQWEDVRLLLWGIVAAWTIRPLFEATALAVVGRARR